MRGDAAVDVTRVSRSFGARPIIDNLSFTLQRGRWLTLRGPSGAGKTTLLRIVCGLEPVDSGGVRIFGCDATWRSGKSKPHLRLPIGYAPQAADLWDFKSVLENVALPLRVWGFPKGEAEGRAQRLLGELGLAEHVTKRPDHLSGGERQRVALARAIGVGRDLLLLDEPTSNLDQASAELVWASVRAAAQEGAAVIAATHSMEAPAGDEALWLDNYLGEKRI